MQMNSQVKRQTGQGLEESKHRSFCPRGIGVTPPSEHVEYSPTQKLSKHCALGIFMEASSHRHDRLLTPFPACSPPQRIQDGAESSKALSLAWSFW